MAVESVGAISPYPVVQLCFLVDDVDAAVARWVSVMGAGPFFVMRHIPLQRVTFRGQPITYDHTAGLGQWGDMQVELHHQHCDSPSPAKELFASGQNGLLQVSWLVDDIDAEVQRMDALGFPVAFTTENEGGSLPAVWFDTVAFLGTFVEVYQASVARPAYDAIKRAAHGWNGERPLRTIDEIAEFIPPAGSQTP
jgi:catechol 2,3-dioxygenase-like lactoylglutathione lyase family enzyme